MGIFRKSNPDVLVVGAGPVGLTSALTLARRGVRVEIVDSEWRSAARSYALALHPSSLDLLDRFGVVPKILELAHRVDTIGLWDERSRRAALRLTELPREFGFVAVVRQDVLERVLEDALREAGVGVHWDHRVSRLEPGAIDVNVAVDQLDKQSGGYAVSHVEKVVARRREMAVPYVIGADGHHSFVRRALGIELEPLAAAEQFAVFEFDAEGDAGHELRIVFSGDLVSACWPLPDGACRWSFQLDTDDLLYDGRGKERHTVQLGSSHFPLLKEETMRALLAARAPWFETPVGPIRWRMAVRFERRLAESFGSERTWLVGDAAHLAAPVGVHSMNAGLEEAVELADTIAGCLDGTATGGDLAEFGARRLRAWRHRLGGSELLAAPAEADPWLAHNAARLPDCLPVSREDLDRLVAQLGLRAA